MSMRKASGEITSNREALRICTDFSKFPPNSANTRKLYKIESRHRKTNPVYRRNKKGNNTHTHEVISPT